MSTSISSIILKELRELQKDMKGVRQMDIPRLKTEIAVIKEKTGLQAKIITCAGAAITLAISTAIAWFK